MKKAITLCAALAISMSLSSLAQAETTILHSPVDLDKVVVEKPVGQIIDPTYGVISFHSGTLFRLSDKIKANEPIDILTPYAGRIFYAGLDNEYGTVVKIMHDNGSISTFGGMDLDSLISAKYRVERGEKIGHFVRGPGIKASNNHLYFEHTLENGHNLSFNFQELQKNQQSNFTVTAQNLGLAQQYYVPLKRDKKDDNGVRPYNFSGSSTTTTTPQQVETTASSTRKRNTKIMSPSEYPIRSVLEGAPPYISIASGADGSNVTYQSLAFGVATPTATPTTASTPTCPDTVRQGLMQRSEQRLQNQKNLRNAVISEPGNVSDLSCFDNYQAIMASVVSGSGLSGGIDIFGGGSAALIDMGMDALAEGTCNQANALMSEVRNKAIDMNAMYAAEYQAWEAGELDSSQSGASDYDQGDIESQALDLYEALISPPND